MNSIISSFLLLFFLSCGSVPQTTEQNSPVSNTLTNQIELSTALKNDFLAFKAEAATSKRFRLVLEGLEPSEAINFSVRIYINNTEVDETTGIESPNYLSSFTHLGKMSVDKIGNYSFKLPPRIIDVIRFHKDFNQGQLSITLVALPLDAKDKPEALAFKVANTRIERY